MSRLTSEAKSPFAIWISHLHRWHHDSWWAIFILYFCAKKTQNIYLHIKEDMTLNFYQPPANQPKKKRNIFGNRNRLQLEHLLGTILLPVLDIRCLQHTWVLASRVNRRLGGAQKSGEFTINSKKQAIAVSNGSLNRWDRWYIYIIITQ